tara:strand:+ start:774 stop:1250 length:477 start_codon:yes stop_codon:yes gene_type:complete
MFKLKIDNLTLKLASNNYFYSLNQYFYKYYLNKFSKFINDYYTSDFEEKEIDDFEIIEIFNNSIEKDDIKEAKKLFKIIQIIKTGKNKNFFIKYLERIINIYVEFNKQKYFTNKYFIFCHFYLSFVDRVTINYSPYKINLPIEYKYINNKNDFELDNF